MFGIVAGVSGATGGSSFVLTAGARRRVASALSMATGAFLAERSEAEVAAANVERERQEIAEHPEEEKEELSLFYQLKGIDEETADEMAAQLAKHPTRCSGRSRPRSSGSAGDRGDPAQAALAAGVSTGLGAIVPVIPFIFTTGTVAIVAAAVISLIAHFLVGAAKSLVTLRTLVVGRARDDARRRDRRRRHVPGRPRAADLTHEDGTSRFCRSGGAGSQRPRSERGSQLTPHLKPVADHAAPPHKNAKGAVDHGALHNFGWL